jgi:glucan phosphoethanolaminetransferase (alkaline phosphatase superfamily)
MSFYDIHGLPLMQQSMLFISIAVLVLAPLSMWIQIRENNASIRESVFAIQTIVVTVLAALVFIIFVTNR